MLTRENFGQQRRFLTVSTLPFLFFLRFGVDHRFNFSRFSKPFNTFRCKKVLLNQSLTCFCVKVFGSTGESFRDNPCVNTLVFVWLFGWFGE